MFRQILMKPGDHDYGFKTDTDCVDPRINIKN